jgi:hypothetical protein
MKLSASPCVNKRGSDEEQLAANVGSQSTLPPSICLWSSLESELSSPKIRFSGTYGTGNSSLCVTGFIASSKFGYCTVCLELEVIFGMFVKQK